MKSYLLIVHLWLWTSLAYGQIREVPLEPEMATGSFRQQLVNSSKMMVVTPNTDASKTALAILKKGGTAVDAAIAATIMLTLTEPNASGIGGGGFLIHYNAATQKLSAYDGRETAPAQVDPKQFLLANGNAMPFVEARVSGKAVGTPGLLRLLELSHQQHGKLPWADLIQPTIDLAKAGFLPSTRLQQLIRQDPHLRNNPAAKLYFFDSQGQTHPPQYQLKNPELAKVLSDIAISGSQAFYSGPLAHQIIRAVQNDARAQEAFN
ncbi:MAG: gamma-glutamyltransferase [Polynucleobacter sp.]|nr:gamma-glutamyltransferase [Polynucleobacter sp.]